MAKITRREALSRSATAVASTGLTPALADSAAHRKPKILIAGGHPDDPETACGGLMLLYSGAGHEVVSLYLTRGEAGISGKSHDEAAAIRTAEADEACRILGARPLFAGQIDGATEINAGRYDTFQKIIEAEKPDVVYTHWPVDTHRDHRVTSLLVYDAWIHLKKPFELYYFEVEMGNQTQVFTPTDYVDITSVERRKRDACLAHHSQNPNGHFYDLHEKMAHFRGQEVGVPCAEAYIRHRKTMSGLM